jgi:hypothetical protein
MHTKRIFQPPIFRPLLPFPFVWIGAVGGLLYLFTPILSLNLASLVIIDFIWTQNL